MKTKKPNDEFDVLLEYLFGDNQQEKDNFMKQAVNLYFDIVYETMAVHDLHTDYVCKHTYLKHLHKNTYECMVCGMEFDYVPKY